jgi:hypothetical protein
MPSRGMKYGQRLESKKFKLLIVERVSREAIVRVPHVEGSLVSRSWPISKPQELQLVLVGCTSGWNDDKRRF